MFYLVLWKPLTQTKIRNNSEEVHTTYQRVEDDSSYPLGLSMLHELIETRTLRGEVVRICALIFCVARHTNV